MTFEWVRDYSIFTWISVRHCSLYDGKNSKKHKKFIWSEIDTRFFVCTDYYTVYFYCTSWPVKKHSMELLQLACSKLTTFASIFSLGCPTEFSPLRSKLKRCVLLDSSGVKWLKWNCQLSSTDIVCHNSCMASFHLLYSVKGSAISMIQHRTWVPSVGCSLMGMMPGGVAPPRNNTRESSF